MTGLGDVALLATGFGLGLRHGIDWDHIAALADITGSISTEEVQVSQSGAVSLSLNQSSTAIESWRRFFLATLYALGHASIVVVLGLVAIWTSEILPGWVDPLMERVVGVTLLILGIWIFYSLWRYGREFRLRSRWMLDFALVGRSWTRLKSHITGETLIPHSHEVSQYSRRTASSIGLIHGIGAETGSQALLLAGATGATTAAAGSAMLLAFVLGLVTSNSLIAALSTFGFVSSQQRQRVYLITGVIAGVFSLVVGTFFVTGAGTALPDLQHLLGN